MTIIDAGLRSCEKCGKPFTPRSGSGGCVQRFCGTDCRLGFHRERLRSQRIGLYAGQSPQQPATQADHDAGRITPTGSPPTSEQKEAAILETRPLEDRIGELEAQVAKLEEELARERFEHNATRGLYRKSARRISGRYVGRGFQTPLGGLPS